jgi:hypothetical protein
MHDSEILETTSPIYEVNPFISRCCVGDTEQTNGRTKHVEVWNGRRVKKTDDLEHALFVWGSKCRKTAIDYGVREKQKYLSQRMCVTNFVHKNSYASGPKMR